MNFNTLPPQVQKMILSAVTSLILAAGASLVTAGWISQDALAQFAGPAAIVVVGLIFGIGAFLWKLKPASKAQTVALAAALPEVSRIVTTPEIANAPVNAASATVITHDQAMAVPPPVPGSPKV